MANAWDAWENAGRLIERGEAAVHAGHLYTTWCAPGHRLATPERVGLIIPERIGRYQIDKLLGQGGQGTVLLARDSELGRPVALKLLKHDSTGGDGSLAGEAQIISQLQHPNIVTLYDVGRHRDLPYLVLEFIDGESLEARIRREGQLSVHDTVILMSQVLAGVAYLHEHGVLHRDLSPANILITREGTPKVTDFGLSVLHAGDAPTRQVAGTLRYMSPEPFRDEPLGPPSDVFTLASILFEMLTGTRQFAADNAPAVIAAIVNGPPIDLASHGIAVDPALATVLATASQRDPGARYADARAMKQALDAYRLPREQDGAASEATRTHSTVEFLLRRIARKKGFSSLSAHIGEVLRLTSDESMASANQLVNVLAKDLTLSQRVLTVANSAAYGRGTIADLPGAVRLLGLDQVRLCVTSALLEKEFELGSPALREAMLCSFHSAVLAKLIARDCGVRNLADAFTGGMFHQLGRTLTIHYLAEEFDDIVERSLRLHGNELTESRQVLGIAYHELGAAVGQQWQLPESIIECMRPLPRGPANAPDTPLARLQLCVAFANAVSRAVMEHEDQVERDVEVHEHLRRMARAYDGGVGTLNTALAECAPLVPRYGRIVKLDPARHASAARLAHPAPVAQAS